MGNPNWKKGVGGNPAKRFSKENQPPREKVGRKKKLPPLDTLLAEVLGQENAEGRTVAEGILNSLASSALKGKGSEKIQAANLLLSRAYGLPKQQVDLTSLGQSITEKGKAAVVKLPDGTILEL